MGITRFIKRVCKQKAVYWGSPVKDVYGVSTFANPVEIDVRWTDKQRVLTDARGYELITKADVLLTQDVDTEGYLYLGTLASLSAYDTTKPKAIPGAYQIIAFDKTPWIMSNSIFVRKVTLGWRNV